jgi:hypothetical protein
MEIGRDTVEIWWRYIRNPNDKAQMTNKIQNPNDKSGSR